MKKTFYTFISGLAFVLLLSSCTKFNDQFDGLDEKTQITNVASYTYTLTDADYSTITAVVNKVANDSIAYYNNLLKTASSADSIAINANITRINSDPD